MRFLLQIVSIKKVKYTSRPLRSQARLGHNNTSLAVSWLMVLAPRWRMWGLLYLYACSIASKSKPPCYRKSWSSAHTTASCKCGEIFSNETQSFSQRTERFSSAACSQVRINMSGVYGTGSMVYKRVKPMLRPKNHRLSFRATRNRYLPQRRRPFSSLGIPRYHFRRDLDRKFTGFLFAGKGNSEI